MTKADIVTDLKAIIGPGNTRDDSQLGVWVNGAYMYAVDEISKTNPDYFTKSATTSIVSGQQEYVLPSDYEKVVMINIKNSGVWVRAYPLNSMNDVTSLNNTNNSQGFSPARPYYYIYNNIVGFVPPFTESVGYGIKIWYVFTPPELATDAEVPAIPAKYHYMLKYGAYADYLDQDDSHAEADRMRSRFYERVANMVENLADNQVDEPKSIQIVTSPDLYIAQDDGII